jgi:hypothetical protein
VKQIRKRITYANVMSSIAVFLVLGGASAYAAKKIGSNEIKGNSITTGKLKKNAVTSSKIKKNSITTAKIKNGAVTGPKINLATLGTVPSAQTAQTANVANSLAGYSHKGIIRATATGGATEAAAAAAAPEIALFTAGPLTVYAKCLDDNGSSETYGVFYIKTSQGGVIVDSDQDDWEGDPFLETNTPEDERELVSEEASDNEADYYGEHSPEFTAMAPNGTVIRGEVQVAVKRGSLPGGDGLYGPGNVCLFAGQLNVLNG